MKGATKISAAATLVFIMFSFAPVYALSISPGRITAPMMPNEIYTFQFNATGAQYIWTEHDGNMTCLLSGGVNSKNVTTPSILDNATIHVLSDAPAGQYSCRIMARAIIPDPQPPVPYSGGGGGSYAPSPNIKLDVNRTLNNTLNIYTKLADYHINQTARYAEKIININQTIDNYQQKYTEEFIPTQASKIIGIYKYIESESVEGNELIRLTIAMLVSHFSS